MKTLDDYGVVCLSATQKTTTRGGNPILAGLGIITTIVGAGKAVDQAAEWFVNGWNDPK